MTQQIISRAKPRAPKLLVLKRVGLALLFFFVAATALAEIRIPAQTPVGKKIEAELMASIPVGAEVQGGWVITDCDTDLESPTKIQIWATPGKHEIKFQGAWMQFELVPIPQPDGTTKTTKSTVAWGFINESASFEVTGGDGPVPPPPPPPPVVGGPYQILFLFDAETKDNLSKQQQAILASLAFRLRLEKAGHRVLGVSAAQSITDPTASKYAAYFEAAKNVPLPCLIVSGMQGGKCVAVPLPADEAAAEKLLKTELLK